MNFESVYFNFFSVGSLIPVLFCLFLSIFFLSIPKKSRASTHLGITLLYLAIFYCAYFASSVLYHPAMAYHRWVTVAIILPSIIHMIMLFLCYPQETYPRFNRIALIGLYTVALIVTGVFIAATVDAPIVYRFDGHYWDFSADNISRAVGIIIQLYLVLVFAAGIWRAVVTRARERLAVVSIFIGFVLSSVVPAGLNILSRDGLIDRATYQISLDLLLIFGFFFVCIIYINNTRDRTTFMAKIIGITLVTLLIILQGFSYYSLNDQEDAYDLVHIRETRLAQNSTRYPADFEYLIAYTPATDGFHLATGAGQVKPDIDYTRSRTEYQHQLVIERLKALPAPDYKKNAVAILQASHAAFGGYRALLMPFVEKQDDAEKNPFAAIQAHLNRHKTAIRYFANKMADLPMPQFREASLSLLKTARNDFKPFADAISSHIRKSTAAGQDLKAEALAFVLPIRDRGERIYRQERNGRHTVAFFDYHTEDNIFYEAGFSYRAYRDFVSPSSARYILVSLIAFIVVIVGYPFFFLGALVTPLRRLSRAMRKVQDGDLEVQIAVSAEDEIGFITRNFNRLVKAIRTAKKGLDDYAENLERKVEERTQKLLEAMENMERAKQETDNILKNVNEGIFLMNTDLVIGAQHSTALHAIFEQETIAGENFAALMGRIAIESVGESIDTYFRVLLNKNLSAKQLARLNPLSDIKVQMSRGEATVQKHLRFNFTKIMDRNSSLVLATVQDITEEKLLAQRIEETEKKAEVEMRLLFGIIHIKPAVLRKFIEEARLELRTIEEELESARFSEDFQLLLNSVYRSVHSIKGNAGQLGLDIFADQAHQFEEEIKRLFDKPDLVSVDLIGLLYSIVGLKDMIREVEQLLERISSFQAVYDNEEISEERFLAQSLHDTAIRAAARENKKVVFDYARFAVPATNGLDIITLKKILLQLVKNAVTHGIETSTERSAAGKPEAGTISVSSRNHSGNWMIYIRDDGGGIRPEMIRQHLVDAGRLSADEAETWPPDRLVKMIFEPGISTASAISIDAGRGIGLDIVRHEIHKMNGKIFLKYAPGKFTEFTVQVPLSSHA